MEAISPYSSEAFQLLPGLEDSNHAFQSSGGQPLLQSHFRDLFVRYNVTDQFGVALVHRHFNLGDDEILVDVNGTSTPWQKPSPDDKTGSLRRYDRSIRPQSWTVDRDGHLMPYEFFLDEDSSGADEMQSVDPAFLAEFLALLTNLKLTGVLGLRLIRGSESRRIEVTERNANITFPVPDGSIPPSDGHLEAAWAFPAAADVSATASSGAPVTRDWSVNSDL
ncbi:hypothetical protein Neosp_001495 [[Neocosmospora] mangrovei]